MSSDQSSLFGDAPPPKSTETLDAINAEMLQRAQLIPELKDRVILPGEGDPATARLTLVGESPGPADIATRRIFNGPSGELLDRIGLKPLLDLGLRHGEGTGAALAAGMVRAALAMHRGMATFDQAKIARKI